jgi:hypothetical protein
MRPSLCLVLMVSLQTGISSTFFYHFNSTHFFYFNYFFITFSTDSISPLSTMHSLTSLSGLLFNSTHFYFLTFSIYFYFTFLPYPTPNNHPFRTKYSGNIWKTSFPMTVKIRNAADTIVSYFSSSCFVCVVICFCYLFLLFVLVIFLSGSILLYKWIVSMTNPCLFVILEITSRGRFCSSHTTN